MHKIKGFSEKAVCVISHFHVFWSVVTRGYVFLAVLSNSCQKTSIADFRHKHLKPWKIDTAIQFINFHRFALSIDKNHLIATDFYRHRFLSIDYSGERSKLSIDGTVTIFGEIFTQLYTFIIHTATSYYFTQTVYVNYIDSKHVCITVYWCMGLLHSLVRP